MASGLTRQETLALTGISSGRLSYLDRTGLVVPEKIGDLKHPLVIYTWEQVLQIKVIDRLREKLSLQEIRKVIQFLEQKNYKSSLYSANLMLIGDKLYLIENAEQFQKRVLEASGKNKGQVVIHEVGVLAEVIAELQKEKHRVLDFDKRVQGTALSLAK
uniref:MerR family transcriptional regulator n=1 Tax=Trichocoleus desertorum TaxID=1481672 RepID=UPI0025B42B3A|nr:MerR family transcriptional regulator [Trichocoleus desertorum]